MKTLSPSQILARLDRRLPFLTSGHRDLPERQRTLRATIEWSYELLSSDERRLFRRLSVFSGGCTLEAAEEVAEADLDTLQSLVDKSLVGHANERFTMLETIREFAEAHIGDAGEMEALRRRHAEQIAGIVPTLGWRARASDPTAIERLDQEDDNARTAFHWALESGELGLCERLVEGLWHYWIIRGPTSDGYRRARAVVHCSPAPSPLFLNLAGELARFTGDLDGAVELKQRAIAELEAMDEGEVISPSMGRTAATQLPAALADLAETLVARGDLDRAQKLAERALAIRERRGDPPGVAHARAALVLLELRRGDYRRAAALSEELIPVWRDSKAWSDLAGACVLAATAHRRAGDGALARERLLEGLRVALDIGDSAALAAMLEQAAALAAESGRFDVALRLYGSVDAWRVSSGFTSDTDDSAQQLSAEARAEHPVLAAAPREVAPASGTAVAEGSLLLEGEYWTIGYAGRVLRLRDSKGLRILARLVATPGRPHTALDLERLGEAGEEPTARALAAQDAGVHLDDEARRAYRARLAELRDDIEQAEALGAADRSGRLREEMDFITRELARGMGLGGRPRRAGSIVERARLNVTRALRVSLRHVAAADPDLAGHLDVAVRTGTVCVYSPDPRTPIVWRVSSPSVHPS